MMEKCKSSWILSVTGRLNKLFGSEYKCPTVLDVMFRPFSSLVKFESGGEIFWYKENPPVFFQEGAVTKWLYSKVPSIIPEVTNTGINWFITKNVYSINTLPPKPAYSTLLDLQIKLLDSIDKLQSLGCAERNSTSLLNEIHTLSKNKNLLTKKIAKRLDSVMGLIEKQCYQLDAMKFPKTLVHGDLTRNNCIWTRSGWVIIDWSDVAIANPLMDLTMSVRRMQPEQRTEIFDAFCTRWEKYVGSEFCRKALMYVKTLGELYQIESHLNILSSIDNYKIKSDIVQLLKKTLNELERFHR